MTKRTKVVFPKDNASSCEGIRGPTVMAASHVTQQKETLSGEGQVSEASQTETDMCVCCLRPDLVGHRRQVLCPYFSHSSVGRSLLSPSTCLGCLP